MIPFLLITLLNEIYCYHLKKNMINTLVYYNIYNYYRFPFLSVIYFFASDKSKVTLVVLKIFISLSVFLFTFNLFTYKNFFKLHSNYFLFGGVSIIIFSLAYLYYLLKKNSLINPLTIPFFWVSTGFLIYFLGVIPSIGVLNILASKNYIIASDKLLVAKLLSIVLYSLLSFSFYFQWKQTK